VGLRDFFARVRKGLQKTKEFFGSRLKAVFSAFRKLDESVLEQIEETLIAADVGVDATMKI
jgi:fused signal recognition particle receptor